MKYAYLYAALLVLVIAIGCGKAPDTVAPTSAPAAASEPTTTHPASQTMPAASYDLSSEEMAKATNFEQGKKTMVSTPYKIMQVGDVYVFGIGIKNVMPKETNYRIQVHFREAKTTGGLATLIDEADDDTMLTWIARNRFSTISVASGEEKVVPFIVDVMPTIGPRESTIPGSYVFDVEIEYESTPRFWDEYESNLLTIKVKE